MQILRFIKMIWWPSHPQTACYQVVAVEVGSLNQGEPSQEEMPTY